MFSQKNRLQSDRDVMRAVRSKRGIFDAACGIKFVTNTAGHPRFAVIVGTKVSKNSVDRNRVRRQYREICKEIISVLPAQDFALLVSKPALALSFQEKRDRLRKAFVKAKFLSE